MKPNQEAALKKLEAAMLACKRAGIVLAGCESTIIAAPRSDELQNAKDASASVQAILQDPNMCSVRTYGCYWDSGSP